MKACLPGLSLAALMLGACTGTAGSGDAGPSDGPAAEVASPGGDAGAEDGSGGENDSRPAPSGTPLPAGVAPPRRLLDASALLTGDSFSGCTHQRPITGDRWCAFARQPASAGPTELWVINVTRAAAGPIPPCDGSDPACLRLTANVWVGGALNGPLHPYAHRFHGDTLIYYADAISGPMQVHQGPAFAWRPGWASPRRISSDRALECWGHPTRLLAHCLEDLMGDPNRPTSMELRAGPIADRDDVVLPSLGRIRPDRTDGQPAWQAGFSPNGELFAYSSPDPDPAIETLKVIATADLGRGAATAIVPGAGLWQISHDGGRVYFLRDEGAEVNSLNVADLPTGANPVQLEPQAGSYTVLGGAGRDQGVSFIARQGPGQIAYRLLSDPRTPATGATLFNYQGQLEAVLVSPDVRFTAWTDSGHRIRLVEHAGLRSCLLNVNQRLPAYNPSFLRSSGLVMWTEDPGGDRDRRDGYFTDPTTCLDKRRFAQAAYFIAPIDDRGVVFADETDDVNQRSTLKYVTLADGKTWPASGPVRVLPDIDGGSVVPVGWDPLLLLFRISGGPADQQGLYVFGPLPF